MDANGYVTLNDLAEWAETNARTTSGRGEIFIAGDNRLWEAAARLARAAATADAALKYPVYVAPGSASGSAPATAGR